MSYFGFATRRMRPYEDGIFGLGADPVPPNYDLTDPASLKQFKMVLNYVMSMVGTPALLPAEIDSPEYGLPTEVVYRDWVAWRDDGFLPAGDMEQTVYGHVIPTAAGLFHLFDQGIHASPAPYAPPAGADYAKTYWPLPWLYHATILTQGPGGTMTPPKLPGLMSKPGPTRASLLIGLTAAMALGALVLFKRRR